MIVTVDECYTLRIVISRYHILQSGWHIVNVSRIEYSGCHMILHNRYSVNIAPGVYQYDSTIIQIMRLSCGPRCPKDSVEDIYDMILLPLVVLLVL